MDRLGKMKSLNIITVLLSTLLVSTLTHAQEETPVEEKVNTNEDVVIIEYNSNKKEVEIEEEYSEKDYKVQIKTKDYYLFYDGRSCEIYDRHKRYSHEEVSKMSKTQIYQHGKKIPNCKNNEKYKLIKQKLDHINRFTFSPFLDTYHIEVQTGLYLTQYVSGYETYDYENYVKEHYNEKGFDSEGYNVDGFNIFGYDKYGYDKEGYDVKGFDSKGYDRNKLNKDGLSKEQLLIMERRRIKQQKESEAVERRMKKILDDAKNGN